MLFNRKRTSKEKNSQNMLMLVSTLVGEVEEVDVFEAGVGCVEAVAGIRVGIDANFVEAAKLAGAGSRPFGERDECTFDGHEQPVVGLKGHIFKPIDAF